MLSSYLYRPDNIPLMSTTPPTYANSRSVPSVTFSRVFYETRRERARADAAFDDTEGVELFTFVLRFVHADLFIFSRVCDCVLVFVLRLSARSFELRFYG